MIGGRTWGTVRFGLHTTPSHSVVAGGGNAGRWTKSSARATARTEAFQGLGPPRRREISRSHELSRRAVAPESTQRRVSAVSAQSQRLHSRCERGGSEPEELRRSALTGDLPLGRLERTAKVLALEAREVSCREH